MMGFLYRLGGSLKDFGERVRCIRIVRIGLAIKDVALKMGIKR